MTEAQSKAIGLRNAYRRSRIISKWIILGDIVPVSMCANSEAVLLSLKQGDAAAIQSLRGHVLVRHVNGHYLCEVEARTIFGLVDTKTVCLNDKELVAWVDDYQKLLWPSNRD